MPYTLSNPLPSGDAPLDPKIYNYFKIADTNKNGTLDFTELSQALRNDAHNNFRPETCRLMINMFDKTETGTINPAGFEALWKYLTTWRKIFNNFDTDKNGTIDAGEFKNALSQLGYNLGENFQAIALAKFDPDRTGSLRFDDFVRFCCVLNNLTQQFAAVDVNRTGSATLNYEQYLNITFTSLL